jgi:predicted nucleic-acid-binding Zn-ribbon protein
MNRNDSDCIHCGSMDLNESSNHVDGEELHRTFECGKCKKQTVMCFNLEFYNSVTAEEYADGDTEAGL